MINKIKKARLAGLTFVITTLFSATAVAAPSCAHQYVKADHGSVWVDNLKGMCTCLMTTAAKIVSGKNVKVKYTEHSVTYSGYKDDTHNVKCKGSISINKLFPNSPPKMKKSSGDGVSYQILNTNVLKFKGNRCFNAGGYTKYCFTINVTLKRTVSIPRTRVHINLR